MRKIITLEERIRVRAYYAWLNGDTYDWRTPTALDHWLVAEQAEQAAAHARSMSARKGAATRANKAALRARVSRSVAIVALAGSELH